MSYPFNDAIRREIANRCAAFTRLPAAHDSNGLKRAAVAITLVPGDGGPNQTAFLLTQRSTRLRAHGGQWALPGGRCDPGEPAMEAALRELDEEIALRLRPKDVLGTLDDYPTRSGYLITPVVVWAGPSPRLHLNPKEVASVHRIPLADIMRPGSVSFHTIPESDRRVIRMHIGGTSLHAPTGAVIYQFREILAGRNTRVDQLEQPVFAWR
ncbi:MAG: CoA pyrophosphatase [Hyphomicrobiaceae bacterium]|nr:MAG: CoA pyrophosphatase [Hyphomicrobiaceae bacterium]